MTLFEPEDVTPLDATKASAAARRVRLEDVRDPDGASFAAAYELLSSFFAEKGEMEPREVLAGFVRDRVLRLGPGLDGTYHLVCAWDGPELVGVRDCYVDIDTRRGHCVVALSHSYVVPAWRRSGLAAVLRTVPVSLARASRGLPTLVAAEMEPPHPDDAESVVRLVAYGRSGFGVVDPRRLQYAQPDFRELPPGSHQGIPLLAVVRVVGADAPLNPAFVAAFPRLFHACHRMYLSAARVDVCERHALEVLARSPLPVGVLPLPEGPDTLARLRPLVRSAVLGGYPPALRGRDPRIGDPDEEMTRIEAAWRRSG